MNSVFTEKLFADKLEKLNSSQQCVETLSHWCIFHRSKAKQVVATWDKQFHSFEMHQKVPLLYLANDIMQNSKRKGNEFVSEFWKVLPSALKEVVEQGDDRGKKVVARLLDVWEERKVFGSCAQNLKDVMLGEALPAPLEFKRKRSHPVKIIKRDTRSLKTKLTIGGVAEKIVTAFHSVVTENGDEDEEMNKCKSAVSRVRNMEEDVEVALSRAKDPKRKDLSHELEAEENIMKQSIEKLKVVEANRVALVSQLRDALNEQESELENIRTQMQVAEAQLTESSNMRKLLDDENYVANPKYSSVPPSSTNPTEISGQTTKKSTKAIAAEVADMLAASSSSQYIMTSVLSTFAAEEAKNAQLAQSSAASNSFSSFPNNAANSSMFPSEQKLSQDNIYQTLPTMQTQISQSQAPYHSLPNAPSQQYLQASGGIMSSYGYTTFPPLPPGPPPHVAPPSYMASPLVPPPTHSSLQINQQQPLTMNNQSSQLNQFQQAPLPPSQPPAPSFRTVAPNQASGMVFYAPPHRTQ